MQKTEEYETKRFQWNENPSIKDYLELSNHGMINVDVFPWKDIIIHIKGGDFSPLTDYQRYRLSKSYKEIQKFVDYFQIKSSVSEDVLERYNNKIGWMLREIDEMKRQIKAHDDAIYAMPFFVLSIIFILFAIFVFLYTNYIIIVVLYSMIAFPCVLITSYIISRWMKKKRITGLQHDIEMFYLRLLPKSVDDLLDKIYEALILYCKQQ